MAIFRQALLAFSAVALASVAVAQPTTTYVSPYAASANPKIPTPKSVIGFGMGDDYHLANYDQITDYLKKLAAASPDRMKLVDIGPTEEGKRQWMAIVSSPENMKKLDHYKEISAKLSHAEGLTDEQAHALA